MLARHFNEQPLARNAPGRRDELYWILGDYFLKIASGKDHPVATKDFLVGLVLYASTAFAWVYLMRHLKLATIGVVYSVCMILLLTGMGVLLFRESLNRYEMAGIAMAIASIVLLSRFG
jgi:multidrug transporter EmrE-like cation transporter